MFLYRNYPITILQGRRYRKQVQGSVAILEGNSELGAHERKNICYLISLRHLIKTRAVTNRIVFIPEKKYFSLRCVCDINYTI